MQVQCVVKMQQCFAKGVHGTAIRGSGVTKEQNRDLTQLDIGLLTDEGKHPFRARTASSEVGQGA